MRYRLLFTVLLSLSLQGFTQVKSGIDWKNFLSDQDMLFDSLSAKWDEGIFLGNGLLGVMIYREDANTIRFDIGRTDVTDHRTGINPSIGRARMPIGKFLFHTAGNIRDIQLRLDLWNAEVKGKIITDKGTIDLQALVAATKDIIIVNANYPGIEKIVEWEWKPEAAQSPFLTLGRDSISKYKPNPAYTINKEGQVHYNYQPLMAGGSYTTAWKETDTKGRNQFLITIASSYPADISKQESKKLIGQVNSTTVTQLITAHRDWWHRFYKKSFISIPDSRLQAFWWIQQYKMASATRAGAYPVDLMGPWYRTTPWPKYWWNLNIQLTYYPFFSSNHTDLAEPLLKMIDDNTGNLAKNTPEPYQYNSAALARSGPYDMNSPVKVVKGNDSTGSAASMELGNLTWLLHVYWQAYEYSMNKEVMKRLFPVLTRAVNYYLHIMEKGVDNKYHLPYTYSPEYPKGITRDANYDLSVLYWGLNTLLYINSQLKMNDSLVPVWKDALANLVPYPQDDLGFRIGKDASFTLSHRHYSHLLMIYPIYAVNWDQLENRDLISRSLKQWEKNNEAWRGYSYTGSGSIYAMMGDGNKTAQLLNEMMTGRFSIRPNTMYVESGPVIETPLSAVTTMNEMLLQSWNNTIRVFPAVPDSWSEASFHDLLAKGAFLVSGVRKNNQTQFIRIKSLAGGPCLIKTTWKAPEIKTTGSRIYKIGQQKDGVISIDLKKGEEVVLYTGIKPSVFSIDPVKPAGKQNYWGLKQVN